jgi:hypothetical protein
MIWKGGRSSPSGFQKIGIAGNRFTPWDKGKWPRSAKVRLTDNKGFRLAIFAPQSSWPAAGIL